MGAAEYDLGLAGVCRWVGGREGRGGDREGGTEGTDGRKEGLGGREP